MSTTNAISLNMDDEQLEELMAAMDAIDQILGPLMQALTTEQRRTLPKMSDAQFAPTFMDVQEMRKDFDAVEKLMPILRKVAQLNSNLAETLKLAGSEAYVAALSYYNSVKLATRMNIPGAKPIYDDLKVRFDSNGNRNNNGTSE